MNILLFWLILSLLLYAAYTLGAQSATRRATGASAQNQPPIIPAMELASAESRLSPWLRVTGHRIMGGILEFQGLLLGKAEEVARKIREAFAGEAVTPLLLEGPNEEVRVVLLPANAIPRSGGRTRWGWHWLLFLATIATTTWAGALQAGVNLLQQPERFAVGLPYSLALLLILGAHELGHYFTAKAHGIRVSPPFFIPIPFGLGTFGAFIKIKSLPPNRRALFDMAVAGPLAGLVFAIPALLVGLRLSTVIPGDAPVSWAHGGVNLTSSVLLAWLAKVSLGASVLDGSRLLLHPLAFAGWLGLIVTALNLLPIGQLALVLLFLVALFVRPDLLSWALIVFFVAGTNDAPTLNDVTPVNLTRRALGYGSFLLLLLIVLPVPHALWQASAVHSYYL